MYNAPTHSKLLMPMKKDTSMSHSVCGSNASHTHAIEVCIKNVYTEEFSNFIVANGYTHNNGGNREETPK